MTRWAVVLLAAAAFFPGCVAPAPPLPAVSWDTPEDARQILIDRQNAIESVQAQLKLKLTTPAPDRETNTLDAALVIRGDDHLRLRAWKLNQTIFDLTATPDGTFIVAHDDMKKRAPDAERDLAKLAENLSRLLRGPDYANARLERSLGKQGTADEDTLVFTWGPPQDRSAVTKVDARSLGVRNSILNPDQPAQTISIEPVQTVYDGLTWYQRVTAEGFFGKIELTFHDVELNGELNPRAFKPSRRAVRIEDAPASEISPP